MMLHWHLIFGTLFIELIVITLLIFQAVPIVIKKGILGFGSNPTFKQASTVYISIVSLLFAETMFELMYGKSPMAAVKGGEMSEVVHEELHHYESETLQHQRNALAASLSIFLLVLFNRLCVLLKESFKLQSDSEVMKKQASNVSNEYMRLLSETKEGKDGEENKLSKENKDLKEKVKDLTQKLDRATSDVSSIKKQAQNQQDSYDQLLQENKSLQNKLSDFTLLLGDSQKKKV